MLMHIEYRRLVVKMRPHRGARAVRKARLRESLDTMILGTLSTAIGLVLLIALASGVARRPIKGWTELAINTSTPYYVPSKDCAIGAMVGVGLGLAGVALARFGHRTISPLSIVGTGMCLLHVSLFFVHILVMEVL